MECFGFAGTTVAHIDRWRRSRGPGHLSLHPNSLALVPIQRSEPLPALRGDFGCKVREVGVGMYPGAEEW